MHDLEPEMPAEPVIDNSLALAIRKSLGGPPPAQELPPPPAPVEVGSWNQWGWLAAGAALAVGLYYAFKPPKPVPFSDLESAEGLSPAPRAIRRGRHPASS